MALHRCMNCGHTDDLSLTNFVCPNCKEQLELIPGEAPMSIPLCTLKSGGYNHSWMFVAPVQLGQGLWQCNDCKTIAVGRLLNAEELSCKQPLPPVLKLEAP